VKKEDLMKSHVELLALINIVSGILGLLAAGVVCAVLFVLAPVANDPVGSPVLLIVAVGVSSFLALFSAPSLIAGIGLLKHKAWARILTLILAIIAVMNVPIGTLIAIYTFWVLTNEETTKILDASA
jgi:hypothetical protein